MGKNFIRKKLFDLVVFLFFVSIGILCSVLEISYILSIILILLSSVCIIPISYFIFKEYFINNNRNKNNVKDINIYSVKDNNKKDLSLNINKCASNIKNKPKVRVRKKI